METDAMPTVKEKISGLSRNTTALSLFIAIGLAHLLGDKLDQVLDEVEGRGQDPNETVGGKPFTHWIGKSEEQIDSEAGEQAGDVWAAFERRGLKRDAKVSTHGKPKSDDENENDKGGTPKFGDILGPELSARGLDDDALLKLPNFGRATLKKFRAWQSDEAKKEK
jgi:hypothetical protein